MKWFRKILSIIAWIGILAYLVFALGLTNSQMKGQKVASISVEVKNLDEVQFVSQKDVIQVLKNFHVKITGEPIDSINKSYIKELVDDIPEVNTSEVFFTPDGILHIKLLQRIPIVRVLASNGSYYLDEENQVMGFSSTYTPHVPVITGKTEIDYIQSSLFDLVEFINNDPFWNAQIEQIQVWSDNEIELVPKLGEQRIFMGSASDYEWKFVKLKALYEKGLPSVGWDIYESIDLRYGDQVVCKKKEYKRMKQ
ncbi:MAG: hypothetical protein J7L96_04080 [Bacteroidales bacterium]|nr:hypothetical protein [Bacteroidales bacterium]